MNYILKFLRFVRNTIVGIMLILVLLSIAIVTLAITLINQIPG